MNVQLTNVALQEMINRNLLYPYLCVFKEGGTEYTYLSPVQLSAEQQVLVVVEGNNPRIAVVTVTAQAPQFLDLNLKRTYKIIHGIIQDVGHEKYTIERDYIMQSIIDKQREDSNIEIMESYGLSNVKRHSTTT